MAVRSEKANMEVQEYKSPVLPWKYTIVGFARLSTKTYVITHRNDPMPFVVHQMTSDGACFYGHYYKTAREAFQRLAQMIDQQYSR